MNNKPDALGTVIRRSWVGRAFSQTGKFASPVLTVMAALTITSMVSTLVTFHQIFDWVLSEWREVLREFWSPVFSWVGQIVGIRIDIQFAELLSFTCMVLGIGLRSRTQPRYLFENKQGRFSWQVVWVSVAVWLITGAAFYLQLFDLRFDNWWVRSLKLVTFQSFFTFSLVLLLFAVLPARMHFAAHRASRRSRLICTIICFSLLGAVFVFKAFPTSLTVLNSKGIMAFTPIDPPRFSPIFAKASVHQCSDPTDIAQSWLVRFEDVDSPLARAETLTSEFEDAEFHAIDSNATVRGAQKLREAWKQIEKDPGPFAEALSREEFEGAGYFSVEFLVALSGFSIDGDHRLSAPNEVGYLPQLKRELDQSIGDDAVLSYLESFLEKDGLRERVSFDELEHRFVDRELVCESSLSASCAIMPPQLKGHAGDWCQQQSGSAKEECYSSENGGQIFLALTDVAGIPAGRAPVGSFHRRALINHLPLMSNPSGSGADVDVEMINALYALMPAEATFEFEDYSASNFLVVSDGLQSEWSMAAELEARELQSVSQFYNRTSPWYERSSFFNWRQSVETYESALRNDAKTILLPPLDEFEQDSQARAELLKVATQALQEFERQYGQPAGAVQEESRELKNLLIGIAGTGQTAGTRQKWASINSICDHVEDELNDFREALSTLDLFDWELRDRLAVEISKFRVSIFQEGDRYLDPTTLSRSIRVELADFRNDPGKHDEAVFANVKYHLTKEIRAVNAAISAIKPDSVVLQYIDPIESDLDTYRQEIVSLQEHFDIISDKSAFIEAASKVGARSEAYLSRLYMIQNGLVMILSMIVLTTAVLLSFTGGMLRLVNVLVVASVLIAVGYAIGPIANSFQEHVAS